jgi:hypothetical protein
MNTVLTSSQRWTKENDQQNICMNINVEWNCSEAENHKIYIYNFKVSSADWMLMCSIPDRNSKQN